jgi:hypothetical protein
MMEVARAKAHAERRTFTSYIEYLIARDLGWDDRPPARS